mmetsp:Transcript_74063/g.228918  ORF Transcript_74063/g.228918 Transcript_74063/m.228918 type:complete len:245 (-) Transcript_74063:86-820(-)
MDPITLHFNIFQAGANAEGKQSLHVGDPSATTIGSLKRQLFAEALEERRTVRFIKGGHVLEDAAVLEQCGLGNGAFIHVSIGNSSPSRMGPSSPPRSSAAGADTSSSSTKGSSSNQGHQDSSIGPGFLLGAIFFAGTAVLLQNAWHKRWYLSMHASQLLCILAAVWVYLLLCHGLPALFQLLALGLFRALGRTTSGGDAPEVGSGSACAAAAAPQAAQCPGRHEMVQLPLAGVNTPGGSSSSCS